TCPTSRRRPPDTKSGYMVAGRVGAAARRRRPPALNGPPPERSLHTSPTSDRPDSVCRPLGRVATEWRKGHSREVPVEDHARDPAHRPGALGALEVTSPLEAS